MPEKAPARNGVAMPDAHVVSAPQRRAARPAARTTVRKVARGDIAPATQARALEKFVTDEAIQAAQGQQVAAALALAAFLAWKAVNATASKGQGTGTITNDDAAPTLSITDVTIAEGNAGTKPAVFTVTLAGTLAVAVSLLESRTSAPPSGAATGTGR